MADDGTVPFERFIEKLSGFKFAALDAAMSRVLGVRGLELVRRLLTQFQERQRRERARARRGRG